MISSLIYGTPADVNTEEFAVESSRDSIATEAILKSRDLLWQSHWHAFSLDRVSYRVNSGMYGYYGSQPAYLLDDIPFDPTMFEMTYFQLFPVSYKQIRSLSARQGAGVYQGVGYTSGILQLNSVPIKDGLSVHSSAQIGHHSGEPGPWVFDPDQVTPNIDRFGQTADAGASIKVGNWYAKGFFRVQSFLNMNLFIQTRIRNLLGIPEMGEWPDGTVTTRLGLVETGVRSNRVDLRVQAIRSESEEFLFFQPVAREIPTDFFIEQYSAVASFLLTGSFGIRTMAQYREKETGYRRNRLSHEFDWHQTGKTARASIYLNSNRFQFDLGSEYKELETNAGGLSGEGRQYIDLFLDQRVDITSGIRFGSYAAVTLHDDEKPARARTFLEIDITEDWTTAFEGSYSELLPEISNPVDEWISSGYNIMNRLGVYAFVPNEIPNTRLYTLSHRNRVKVSDNAVVELDIQYLNHLNFQVPFQDAWYSLKYSTTPGGYFLFTDQTGQRLNIFLDADIKWSDTFSQKTGVYWNRTLQGDKPYKSYWKTIPEYLIRHSSFFTPYQDLEIRLNVQYQSQSIWDEFRRLDGKLNRTFNVQFPYQFYTYSSRVDPSFNADLFLSKWFWEQRLRAVFMLSNLFNQDYQTHPIGSREGFGYMFRLELRL